jgi:signal transduction histidine kinase
VNLNRYLRTTSFRLVAVYTGAFVASIAGLFALVYWVTSSALTEQLKASIDAETTMLIGRFEKGGMGGLADEINKRLSSNGRIAYVYLLQDAAGRKVKGNLGPRQPFTGWRELPVPERLAKRSAQDPRDNLEDAMLVKGRLLPDGAFLLVGVDRFHVFETQEAIIRAFSWAAAAAILLALTGGTLVTVGFLRRVDVINRTSQEIIAGNLSERIPQRGVDDEMDRLAENINEMLDRIQVLMEGLRQVSNDIAHDLRTPLSRLKQRLDTARQTARTIEDYDHAIEDALVDADTALATFAALLRIAQIESGSRRSSFAKVNLSQIIEDVVATYRPVAEDLGKSVQTDISPAIETLGDRELLVQMFVNLLENALRHTPEHAQVSISLGTVRDAPVAVVADNGLGIPKMERSKVFRRFYRLDKSRLTPGSGLGLALVAAVAELHRIHVQLEDNKPGLRVVLRFSRDSLATTTGTSRLKE